MLANHVNVFNVVFRLNRDLTTYNGVSCPDSYYLAYG